MEKVVEIPIANVARVEIVTEEDTPKTYRVTTGSEMTLEAFVSEGEEKELRKGNRIIAQLKTEDLVKGYDIKMKDLVMTPQVYALLDGGEATLDGETNMMTYTGPAMGDVVERKPFTLNVYTEEKNGDGETMSYLKITCTGCKGTPASLTLKDGDFFSPEYTIKSRAKRGVSPLTITQMATMPA